MDRFQLLAAVTLELLTFAPANPPIGPTGRPVSRASSAEPIRPPAEQGPRWKTMTEVFREHEWGDAINNLLDIVNIMPAKQYALRPARGLRTFGEVVGHITNVQLGFCNLLKGNPNDSTNWEKRAAKAEAIRGLKSSIRLCDDAFDGLTDEQLLKPNGGTINADLVITFLGHTRRETGKLVTYLRLAGVIPPEIHYMLGRAWRP